MPGCLAALLAESHGFKAVTFSAGCRVHGLQVLPDDLGHAQFVLLELFRCIDGAHEVTPDIHPGIEMRQQTCPQFWREVTVGAGDTDAEKMSDSGTASLDGEM